MTTARQQLSIDVVHGASAELSRPRLSVARRRSLAAQLADVAGWLAQEFGGRLQAGARGVDVSNWQSDVSWDAVAGSGVAFAFAKASESVGFTDPYFRLNWRAMRAAGLVRGAYHYAQPDENEPEAEAERFLGVVRAAGGIEADRGDMLALDLEAGSGDLREWAVQWLRHVEAATGVRPLLYSGVWFLGPHGCLGDAELGSYPLWLAAYQPESPLPPAGWERIAIWQHSSSLTVPGVSGPCDGNVVLGGIISG